MQESDAVIIGGGHNGLVCAFYLARAGRRVTVLERRGVVGGAAITEEFHPGFRNSVASYTVSLLSSKVIAEVPGLDRATGVRAVPAHHAVYGWNRIGCEANGETCFSKQGCADRRGPCRTSG